MQAAVGIGKCDPFMEDHWDNAGSNRIVGQECEVMVPTNEQGQSEVEVDRSQLVAFYLICRSRERKRETKRLNPKIKMISARVAAAENPCNRDLNQKTGRRDMKLSRQGSKGECSGTGPGRSGQSAN